VNPSLSAILSLCDKIKQFVMQIAIIGFERERVRTQRFDPKIHPGKPPEAARMDLKRGTRHPVTYVEGREA